MIKKLFTLILVLLCTNSSLVAQMVPNEDGTGYVLLPTGEQGPKPAAPPIGVDYLQFSLSDGGHIRSIFIPRDAVDMDYFILRPRILGESSPREIVIKVLVRDNGFIIDPQYMPLFRYVGKALLLGGKRVDAFEVYPAQATYTP